MMGFCQYEIYFEMKFSDSKIRFVERRFDIIVISFSSSNDKCLQVRDYIYGRSYEMSYKEFTNTEYEIYYF